MTQAAQPPSGKRARLKRARASENVFISFASKDLRACQTIRLRLEGGNAKRKAKDQISCWMCYKGINPSEKWPEIVAQKLQKAKAFLLLLSEASIKSQHVKDEVNIARARWDQGSIQIVPFRLDQSPLDDEFNLRLGRIQQVNAQTKGWNRDLPDLVMAVEKALSIQREKDGLLQRLSRGLIRLTSKAFLEGWGWGIRTMATAVVVTALVIAAIYVVFGNHAPVQTTTPPTPATSVKDKDRDKSSDFDQDHRPPPDPKNRYGAIEVSMSGVRAVVVTLDGTGKEVFRERNYVKDPPEVRSIVLEYDGQGERFTEPSVESSVKAVEELRDWLEKARGLPANHIRVVIGCGVQRLPDGKLHFWDNDPCVEQLLGALQNSPRLKGLDVKAVEPQEMAACVAVQVVPDDVQGEVLVINVGRDSITATRVRPANNTFPPRYNAIGFQIPGTATLDRLARRENKALPNNPDTPDQRTEYADNIKRVCDKTIVEVLSAANFSFKWDDVYVVGEDTWAVCQPELPGARRRGLVSLDERKFEERCKQAIDNGAKRGTQVSPEYLLAGGEVLRAMNKSINLGKKAVKFVDGSQVDWLDVYLERKFK